MDRCAIFIDGAYVTKIFKRNFGGLRVDYQKLVRHIVQESDLLRTYYYDCPPYQSNPAKPDESARISNFQKFEKFLTQLPKFEVRLGKLEFRGLDSNNHPIFGQKRVDILLGVDMVQLAATGNLATAILVAGDSDFLPAIEVVKQLGVKTVLWHGPHGTWHNDLWNKCDERFESDMTIAKSVAREGKS